METTREAYRAKMEAQLKQWDAQLATLQARAEKAGADAKVKLVAEVEEMKKLRDKARQHVATVANKTWDEVKSEVTEQWSKVSGALDALWARVSR